ncbi:MAG TPA: ABC transporter permease, partial [Blastocatellia bacterium]|nr:ABC transporter permease [Blastocatellia bacterium]
PMNTLWQDLRFGARMMVKAPGFTLIAVLSIALGIALNSAVFTFVNGMLFKPMPVRDPEGLVALYTIEPNSIYPGQFSYPDYIDYRDHNQVFSDLFIHLTTQGLSLKGRDGAAEMVCGELVTGNYFTGLRLDPEIGRLFTPDDDKRPGGHPVAVLSHAFWQRRFGGATNVVGQIVKLNGHDFTVIGVAKKGFSGTRRFGWIPDVFLPLMMYAQALPGTSESFLSDRGNRSFNINGRLRDGVTIEQARAAMRIFARRLANDYPQTNANLVIGMIPASTKVHPAVALMGILSKMIGAMMGLVGLVLLVACANVANLLLARATARRREIAVRLAMGASRRRLIRQLLTESVLLSTLGGLVGLVLAVWLSDLFRFAVPKVDFDTADFDYDLSLDYRVLGFTLALSVLTGVIFGLAPALQSSRPDLVTTLKGETAGVGAGRHRFNLRNLLVVAQVALSLMLLVSAGLLVKSMRNAQAMNPGFRSDRLLMASVNVGLHGYDEARGRRFYKQLGERLQSLSGVEQASFAGPLPLDQYFNAANVTIEGRVPKAANDRLNIGYSIVGPKYFETMNTPVVQGRAFTESDNENAPRVVIVNETMARRYWPNQNPIGKRMRLGDEQSQWLEVAGVARDGKYITLDEPPVDYFFLPFWQNYDGRMTLIAHTTGDPESIIAGIRQEVKALDEQLPVYGVRDVTVFLDTALSVAKATAATVSGFGLVALLLAAIGLYGVMSYAVAERTREIGVRVALGAEPRDLKLMILRQGLRLSLGGAALGLAGALGLARLLRSQLYDVSPTDPLTFGAVALSLIVVALLACWIPARRATKVDPMVALRRD